MTNDDRLGLITRTASCTAAAFFVLHVIPETITWDVWTVVGAFVLYTFVAGPLLGGLGVFLWDGVTKRLGDRPRLAALLLLAALLGVAAMRRMDSAEDARFAQRDCREAYAEEGDDPAPCAYREVWRRYLPEPDSEDEYRGFK
jgi:hypothetical protein